MQTITSQTYQYAIAKNILVTSETTQSELQKTLRELFNMDVLMYKADRKNYEFHILGETSRTNVTHDTYEQAFEAGLIAAINFINSYQDLINEIMNANKFADDLVTFNIAKQLQLRQFNEPCRYLYDVDGDTELYEDYTGDMYTHEDSVQHALDNDYPVYLAPTNKAALAWLTTKLS
jgi:carboxypeptidase C (cathepsin A)